MVEQLRQEQEPKRTQTRLPVPVTRMVRSILAAATIMAVSWGVIYLGAARADQEARHNLLMRARTSAALLDPCDIADLTQYALGDDLRSSDTFIRVLDRLRALYQTSEDTRFVYIVQPVDGQIVSILDAEPEDSPDYSPPGQSMYPATPGEMALFASGTAGVEGPRADPWGTWITAYAPIASDSGDSPVAFLAMDIDASAWPKYALFQWTPVFLTVAFLAALAVFMVVLKYIDESRHARYLAERDYLTGLANRATLIRAIDRAILQARKGGPSALLAIDIDNFKALNHTLTYSMGDEILVAVAGHVKTLVRRTDMVARLAGDEFAVLLTGVARDEALATAERIRSSLEMLRFEVRGMPVYLTVSTGMIEIGRNTHTEDVAMRADMALAAAKEAGKNRIAFSPTYAAPAPNGESVTYSDTLAIEAALRGDRLLVYLQPIVPVTDTQPQESDYRCFEALVRMIGADNNVVPAGKFVPIAEGLGLIPQIDMWVLDRVIELLSAQPDVSIAMNLSARSIARPSFLEQVEAKVKSAGIGQGRLCFEITETAAMGNVSEVRSWMNRMKALGCVFAVDDFGVGHSAISYLYELPVDIVKIAGNVVQSMRDDSSGKLVVEAINSVSHVLGAKTVAECVEDEECVAVLQDMGIDFGQGYYFARPMPAHDALA
ncbi:MAG TPA: bifunctional diguanylate cyclase/phosphodiesterase [Bacillota bacterium]|nr:bifunctional diguanylate cyclase/phosphodiesterase [Bacillota bacterium]